MDRDEQPSPQEAEDGPPPAHSKRGLVLTRLAQGYGQALHRFFERRVSVKADVPDLVQDVYLRLSRMDDPTAIEKPEHFLFVTAANVLKDSARRAAVRDTKFHDELRNDLVLPSSDIPADRVLESKEAAIRLQAVLLELPERSRDVFVLRVMEGLKMADVARALGVSTRAAEKHQARALAHVAAAFEDWRHR
ncbi:RNA polymerase sigma factor [Novosphingobium rosa]|uniref:RNA polymerase sigma factor n=1 Tax=Novosphingobium rosa TaxID=76978 RepID=UPI0009FC261E|nr:sigma-70 family RNA polymerase sigma factor [Novosphingobium rosa]